MQLPQRSVWMKSLRILRTSLMESECTFDLSSTGETVSLLPLPPPPSTNLDVDLDGDSGRQLLRVLIQMVTVNNSTLASHALKLLIRHFSQRKEMVEGFKQVQLLVSKKDIENFNKIRKNLDRLKLLVEEAELWVQKLPRGDEAKPTAQRVRGVGL